MRTRAVLHAIWSGGASQRQWSAAVGIRRARQSFCGFRAGRSWPGSRNTVLRARSKTADLAPSDFRNGWRANAVQCTAAADALRHPLLCDRPINDGHSAPGKLLISCHGGRRSEMVHRKCPGICLLGGPSKHQVPQGMEYPQKAKKYPQSAQDRVTKQPLRFVREASKNPDNNLSFAATRATFNEG